MLERAGVPHQVVLGAAGITAIKVGRTWAEAYVPYVNYRGTKLDTQGKFWIPLDAAFKRLEHPRASTWCATSGSTRATPSMSISPHPRLRLRASSCARG